MGVPRPKGCALRRGLRLARPWCDGRSLTSQGKGQSLTFARVTDTRRTDRNRQPEGRMDK
eukprot:3169874-Lingulodinium_polyedra.AAC.1